MSRLFISYSRQDSKEVDPLSRKLEQNGHSVWLDRSAIQGGSRWQEEIVRGIERADVFLVILSPESIKSENVEKEIGLAYVRNKPILPVILHPVSAPPRLQYAFAGREIIDISRESSEAASARLLDAITSPVARTRKVYLGELRRWKILGVLLWVTILALFKPTWPPPAVDYLLVLAILAAAIAWVGRKRLESNRLENRGIVLITDFKGFLGQGPVRIVSEWHDPATGKHYEFRSKKVSAEFSEFVETKIPVLADPKNFNTYRVDLSFLPTAPRGALGLRGNEEAGSAGGEVLPAVKASPGHIFLSFSEQDGQTIDLLVRKLEVAGHKVWTARGADQDDRHWEEQVVNAIDEAALFLLALSPASAASERVARQLELATAKANRIVTILLRRTVIPENMNYALVGAPRIDLSEDFESGVARLLDTAGKLTSKGTGAPIVERAVPPASFLESFTALFGFEGARSRVLMAHGIPLLTDYKHVHVSSKTIDGTDGDPGAIVVEGRVLTQWRHPVSHQLYLFRSAKVSPDAGDSIKTKSITVYVDPKNMRRYHMDVSFLGQNKRHLKHKNHEKLQPPKVAPSSLTAEQQGIFLSYSRQDADSTALLIRQLQAEGYEIVNRSLPEPAPGDEAVQKSIAGARLFLLLVPSPDASDLDDKTKELRFALASRARIVPVVFGDSPVPLSMELALAGIQRIVLAQGQPAGIQPLLRELAPMMVKRLSAQTSFPAASRHRPRSFLSRVRERLTGALVGGLAWTVGSILPALLSAGSWKTSFGMSLPGFVLGSISGAAFYKRRVALYALILVVGVFGFILFIFGYLLTLWLLALPGTSNERMVLGSLLGCGAFVLSLVVESHMSHRWLKKKGRLLLTEYKGVQLNMSESHNSRHFIQVVSEWRDPANDEVHVFLSRNFSRDPSKRIHTSTIAVFVDPNNFQTYYMDLSLSAKRKQDSLPSRGTAGQ